LFDLKSNLWTSIAFTCVIHIWGDGHICLQCQKLCHIYFIALQVYLNAFLTLFAIVNAILKIFYISVIIGHHPPLLPSVFEHLEISFNFILSICWTEWIVIPLFMLSIFITNLLLMIIPSIVFEWGLLNESIEWIVEYHQSRPGLEVLQHQIDDFIIAHEEKLEEVNFLTNMHEMITEWLDTFIILIYSVLWLNGSAS